MNHSFRSRQDEFGAVFPDICAVCAGPKSTHEIGEFQVVMLEPMRKPFEEWLASRDLHLYRMPDMPDDLPTYGIGYPALERQ